MKKLSSILLAVDFGESSNTAARVAESLATTFRSRMSLIHVLPEDPGFPFSISEYRGRAANAMQDIVTDMLERQLQVDESTIAVGHPVNTILRKAEEVDAHLIVVGSGQKESTGIFVGPTTEAVASRSAIPVLSVNPSTKKLDTIVCPIDNSPVSVRGLQNAVALAEAFESRLIVTTVVPTINWLSRLMDNTVPEDIERSHEEKWRIEFARVVESCQFGKVNWEQQIRSGVPHDEIISLARECEADLLVMGSSGQSSLARTMLGSVTRRVLQRSPCALLVVKHEDVLEDWLETEISLIRILLAEATALLESGSCEPALAKFNQVLVHNPYNVEAMDGMAAAYRRLGNDRKAERYLRRATLLRDSPPQTTVK